MPKKKKGRKPNHCTKERQLEEATAGQTYGYVTATLGSMRLIVLCEDTVNNRLCLIRRVMRKKVWVNMGDFVLVSLREFDKTRGDVIHKYFPEEVKKLKRKGLLNRIQAKIQQNNGSDGIQFVDDDVYSAKLGAAAVGEDGEEEEEEEDEEDDDEEERGGGGVRVEVPPQQRIYHEVVSEEESEEGEVDFDLL